jgi:hypothetical protein
LNWESGGCKTGAFGKKRKKKKEKKISTGNHFEEEDIYPAEL